jgi:hypothetical protein
MVSNFHIELGIVRTDNIFYNPQLRVLSTYLCNPRTLVPFAQKHLCINLGTYVPA